MRTTSRDRALEVLGDYLFELETKNHKAGKPSVQDRSVSEKLPPPTLIVPSQFGKRQEQLVSAWEQQQIRKWKKSGRITIDGHLRVGNDPLKPYTLEDIIRIMPHLNAFDRLAALIDLNGIVPEGYMQSKEHQNIREVVEHIADERLARRLQDGDTALMLKDIIRAEVSEIFGEVLTKARTPISTQQGHKSSGRQNKCSNCHMPGHRATTCGKRRDESLTPPADAAAETDEERAAA